MKLLCTKIKKQEEPNQKHFRTGKLVVLCMQEVELESILNFDHLKISGYYLEVESNVVKSLIMYPTYLKGN